MTTAQRLGIRLTSGGTTTAYVVLGEEGGGGGLGGGGLGSTGPSILVSSLTANFEMTADSISDNGGGAIVVSGSEQTLTQTFATEWTFWMVPSPDDYESLTISIKVDGSGAYSTRADVLLDTDGSVSVLHSGAGAVMEGSFSSNIFSASLPFVVSFGAGQAPQFWTNLRKTEQEPKPAVI